MALVCVRVGLLSVAEVWNVFYSSIVLEKKTTSTLVVVVKCQPLLGVKHIEQRAFYASDSAPLF